MIQPALRQSLIRHAIALDLVLVATGVAFLVHTPVAVIVVFATAVGLSAWFGQEEVGLVATGYAVIVQSLFFGDLIEVDTLTAFAVTGAILSMFVRATRQLPAAEAAPIESSLERRAAVAPPARTALPFEIGLPLLVVVVYTDISDTIMRLYKVPSLLQPTIALLMIVVWTHRRQFHPRQAVVQAVTLLFAAFVFVNFTTTIWAVDLSRADARFGETLKALVICGLVASLSPTWALLRSAMKALVTAAAVLASISSIQVLTGHLTHVLGGLVFLDTGQIYGNVSAPRASGPPVNDPNFYGRILLITIPLAVGLGVAEKRSLRRLLWFAAAGITTAGTLVTYSRGDMIALAAMGALFLIAARVPPVKIAAGALVAAVLLAFLPAAIEKRLSTLEVLLPGNRNAAVRDSSVEIRKLYALAAIEMFRQHPIAGVGAGNFGRFFLVYSNVVGSTAYNYEPAGAPAFPHSQWLEIASETGILGVLPFAATLAAGLVTLFHCRRILLQRGQHANAVFATALMIAVSGYMVASVVLHDTHLRYIGMYLGLVTAVARLTRHPPAERTAGVVTAHVV